MPIKRNKKLRIGVIFGGKSAEHEVSVRTAAQVMANLSKDSYRVIPIKIPKSGQWPHAIPLQKLKQKIDLAFIVLHGPYGEDGTIQGMMEMLGVPYTFSGVLASSLAMNKAMLQLVASSQGILVPRSVLIRKGEPYNASGVAHLGARVVVKPNSLGSSVGVSIIKNNPSSVGTAIKKALRNYDSVLVQECVTGMEVTASVLGNRMARVLPLVEIVPKATKSIFFDYTAKYSEGGSEHVIPARLSGAVSKKVQGAALRMHTVIGSRGVSRSDFIVTPKGEAYFLETNTIPGMTSASLLPDAARAAGIAFPELLDTIISLALEK